MPKLRRGEKVMDFGSGNGRLFVAIAQAGAEAHGVEHNPLLVWRSRRNIERAGLVEKDCVRRSNFWNENLSSYDAVVIYGILYILEKLKKKLQKKLHSGARGVSTSFKFPTWKPVKSDRGIYLYHQS